MRRPIHYPADFKKHDNFFNRVAVPVAIVAICALIIAVESRQEPLSTCPPLMLWAWERPEHLDWIEPSKVGVAFLSRTISIKSDKIVVYPRRQLLVVPGGTYAMAVVRIESGSLRCVSEPDVEKIARYILSAIDNPRIKALQIDFDARESELPCYKLILTKVRRSLPSAISLSMTALVSWCANGNTVWLNSLPVDEIVPMFFRMGVWQEERTDYLNAFAGKALTRHLIPAKFRGSIGLATDEISDIRSLQASRVYLFSPDAWTFETLKAALAQMRWK